MFRIFSSWRAGLALACLLFVGCGGSSGLSSTEETSIEHQGLRDIAEMYRVHTINTQGPPKRLADLAKLETVGANGLNAAREGKLVVRMEAKLPDINEEPGKSSSPEILAYEAKAPEEGGYVLLLDRTIKKMTAEEFKAATMAGVAAPAEATKKGTAKP